MELGIPSAPVVTVAARHPLGFVAERAGHLAFSAGMYMVGSTLLFRHASGIPARDGTTSAITLACVWTLGVSVYLLDRVKLSDRLLDPADQSAHPARYEFLGARTRGVRLLAALCGVSSLLLAWNVHPLATVVVAFAHVGVLLYAGPRVAKMPGRGRVKDVFLIKNLAVAGSITAMAGAMCLLSSGVTLPRFPFASVLTTAGVLVPLILGDAILCDLDDAVSDGIAGTQTIASLMGVRPAWAVAGVMHLVACIALLIIAHGTLELVRAWAIGLVACSAILFAIRPGRVRDLVDTRLGVIGICFALSFGVW